MQIQLETSGEDASASNLDTSRHGFKFYVGKEIHTNGSVELGYLDLGKVNLDIQGTITDLDEFIDAVDQYHPETGQGYTIHYFYRFYQYQRVGFKGRVGLFSWASKYALEGQTSSKIVKDNGTDLSYGLLADYRFSEAAVLRFEAERYEVDDSNLDYFSLGVNIEIQ